MQVQQPPPYGQMMPGQQPGYPQQQGYPVQQGYPQAYPQQQGYPHGYPQVQPGMLPQGTPGGYQVPPGQVPPSAESGPQKTVALQPSDGIVSAARQGGVVPQVGAQAIGGASTLFWIVSLFVGIAVGVLAYVIVLQVS
jgi:hypothetical protein